VPDENPFWEFSVELYKREGVANACLRLQDRCGADVNILMYCCWAAYHHGAQFDADTVDRILSVVAAWQTAVIKPLRDIRRALKAATHQGIAPDAQERLRNEIKHVELRSERLQQNALFSVELQSMDVSKPAAEARKHAQRNVEFYLTYLDVGTDKIACNDAKLIIDAVFD